MELFFGSLVAFLFAAVALGIGMVIRGRPMHAGCGRLPGSSGRESKALCAGVCRRKP
jgi:hypothetical protein